MGDAEEDFGKLPLEDRLKHKVEYVYTVMEGKAVGLRRTVQVVQEERTF